MPSSQDNAADSPASGVRFGRTVVEATTSGLVDTGADGVVVPANRRGVMGVGPAGAIRLEGGAEIERELMARAPFSAGTATVTTSGLLSGRGVSVVIHAVVNDVLGSAASESTIRRATGAVLEQADRARVRVLAMPSLAGGAVPYGLEHDTALFVMIEEIVAYLRRFTSRLDRIVICCRDEREVQLIDDMLVQARRDWWGLRV